MRASNAEVWTHRHNRVQLEAYESIRAERNAFYMRIMAEAGVPLEERQRLADSRRSSDRHAEAVRIDRDLDEGDGIELADRAWRVYHTPGHAGGLICLFDPISRVLLSNDHLLRDISSNPVIEPDPDGGPRPHRLVQYLHHMQRMAESGARHRVDGTRPPHSRCSQSRAAAHPLSRTARAAHSGYDRRRRSIGLPDCQAAVRSLERHRSVSGVIGNHRASGLAGRARTN